MSGWTKKRFWQDATVVQTASGFTVHLDGKALKTPAKADFIVPKRLLADAVATEWQAQGDIVKPDEMPVTRTVNSALDKVGPAHSQVADLVADYAEFDLICYRADTPQALIDLQAEAWDPLVTWSARALLAPLNVSYGLMPVVQPAESLVAASAPCACGVGVPTGGAARFGGIVWIVGYWSCSCPKSPKS